MRIVVFLVCFVWLTASTALAHDGIAVPDDVWTHWNLNPWILISLLLPATLFLRGAAGYRVERGRTLRFTAGMAMLAVAFISPLDALSGALFSAHMVQHLILILAAAPLLVWSNPGPPMLRGIPKRWRARVARATMTPSIRVSWHWLRQPLIAGGLHVVALTAWHAPSLYDAALQHEFVHILEHGTFFLSAAMFWWAIATTGAVAPRILSIFGVMLVGGALGALLTFATTTWYSQHLPYIAAWGLTPLQDQQIAGMLMWAPGGALYAAAAVYVFGDWLDQTDRRARAQRASDA